mmetsp:Transcript_6262/g.15946  ORF Transcript_6262/g.15946 Transcript_6262/m.15946 type:complete len:501 (+) Transcript_6262:563-2065(+)
MMVNDISHNAYGVPDEMCDMVVTPSVFKLLQNIEFRRLAPCREKMGAAIGTTSFSKIVTMMQTYGALFSLMDKAIEMVVCFLRDLFDLRRRRVGKDDPEITYENLIVELFVDLKTGTLRMKPEDMQAHLTNLHKTPSIEGEAMPSRLSDLLASGTSGNLMVIDDVVHFERSEMMLVSNAVGAALIYTNQPVLDAILSIYPDLRPPVVEHYAKHCHVVKLPTTTGSVGIVGTVLDRAAEEKEKESARAVIHIMSAGKLAGPCGEATFNKRLGCKDLHSESGLPLWSISATFVNRFGVKNVKTLEEIRKGCRRLAAEGLGDFHENTIEGGGPGWNGSGLQWRFKTEFAADDEDDVGVNVLGKRSRDASPEDEEGGFRGSSPRAVSKPESVGSSIFVKAAVRTDEERDAMNKKLYELYEINDPSLVWYPRNHHYGIPIGGVAGAAAEEEGSDGYGYGGGFIYDEDWDCYNLYVTNVYYGLTSIDTCSTVSRLVRFCFLSQLIV